MSKVFITQEAVKKTDSGAFRAIMDYTPASEYGDLIVVVPGGTSMLSPVPTVRLVKNVLMENDFTQDDYIIPVGSPLVIGIVFAIASAKTGGKFNVLSWDKKYGKYIPIKVDITGREI
jgi:hypothetical protein